jgi:hypothetical protein
MTDRVFRFESGGVGCFINALGLLVLLGAIALLASTLSGCGGNALRDQARAATITAGVLHAGGDLTMASRASSLDRVEVEHPTDPEHDAAVLAEHTRWQPVVVALDGARAALLTWIDSLELARIAGGGEDLLPSIATLAARAVQLAARALELASALGVEGLPAIPPIVTSIATAYAGR